GLSLPRLGFEFLLPKEYQKVAYYGCGPHENTIDRRGSAGVGRYETTVEEQFVPYAKPTDCGSRTDVHWVELNSENPGPRHGLRIEGLKTSFIFSALPYRQEELLQTTHLHRLPTSRHTVLNIDARQTGIGGNSCGPTPMNRDRLHMEPVSL